MTALAERKIIPHEELKSRSERRMDPAHADPADREAEVLAEAEGSGEADAEAWAETSEQAQDGPGLEIEARPDHFRLLEALLFAASEPLDEQTLSQRLPEGVDVREALRALQLEYAPRGVNLVKVGSRWAFRTAADLSWLLTKEQVVSKKLSRAAIETLAVIAYHQPITRAEIEEIRGVAMSKGTFDVLMETGWVRPRGRRKAPGRPITYGTSEGIPPAVRPGSPDRPAGP